MANEVRGIRVLQDPKLNKSTAFTESEKQALGLVGLVPDFDSGLARVARPADTVAFIRSHVYKPAYKVESAKSTTA